MCLLLKIVAKEEGVIAGLWRGTGANVSRAMLLSGTQLGTYDQVKQMVRDLGLLEEGPPLHLSAALVSGIAAQTVAMPAGNNTFLCVDFSVSTINSSMAMTHPADLHVTTRYIEDSRHVRHQVLVS